MIHKPVILTLLAVLLLGLVSSACDQASIEFGTVQIGFVQNLFNSHWNASYATFSGKKTDSLHANSGDVLSFRYETAVNKGDLDIQIQNPDGTIAWEKSMASDDAQTLNIPLEQTGKYIIRIIGDGTGGSWNLNWDVKKK